ncbi:MAG TPA: hypothetical protein VJG66_02720 [Patescibacteria group bacterium]|nr:hypothetical protein [Patescibacteria group bacterium]
MDFVATEKLFREEGAPEEVVKAAAPDIYVGLRNMATGLSEFVDLKGVQDSVDLVISSMSVHSITKRRRRRVITKDGRRIMGADPLDSLGRLVEVALNKLKATDVVIFCTSNPFDYGIFDNAFDHAVNIIEYGRNRRHLFKALYELRYANKSPEYFTDLFSGSRGVNILGFYPGRMPIRPNELDLDLMSAAVNEAELFGRQIGAETRLRLMAA